MDYNELLVNPSGSSSKIRAVTHTHKDSDVNCKAYLVVVPEGAESLQGAGLVVRALRGGQAGPVGLSGSCQEG